MLEWLVNVLFNAVSHNMNVLVNAVSHYMNVVVNAASLKLIIV